MAKLCKDIDALLCYAYLGDVTASVTGDRKAQKFEDDYLNDVIACIKTCGIRRHLYADPQHAGAAGAASPPVR